VTFKRLNTQKTQMKIRLALIFGGRSGEHEISIISARSIAQAINHSRYHITPIYITKDGKWLGKRLSQHVLSLDYEHLIKDRAALCAVEAELAQAALQNLFKFDFSKFDVAFPVLHGPFGEDGTIQGLLEMHNVPYVGCGVLACALTMDKAFAKICFKAAGLRVAKYLVVFRDELPARRHDIFAEAEKQLGYPMFVKPARLGSSVGISKAKNRRQLHQALTLAAEYDTKLLVEQAINARELEVAVLGNTNLSVSVVGEIVPVNEFYDYEAKYVKSGSQLFIPAALPKALARKVQEAAKTAYRATGCEGMARADFFLERQTNRLFINELNAIPGFTSISMYPKLFEASGIAYPTLIDQLIALAFERHEQQKKNKVAFL